MLTHLAVRDFAIIDALDLDLREGLSVLTGETGAGKSILVDALGLALGGRADMTIIRHGAERAEITADFDLQTRPQIQAWLQERDWAATGECIVHRVIGRDGRSRGQINGRSVPLQSLTDLGNQLVDIHGQHEHQSLLRPSAQLSLLDSFANDAELLGQIVRLHQEWKTCHERLTTLQAAGADRDARAEFLHHQISELEALALQPGEILQLDEEHRRLASHGKLIEGAQDALNGLYENDEGSAYRTVHRAIQTIDALSELDPRFDGIRDTLTSAAVQLADASDALRHYLRDADVDPRRLEWVEQRLGSVHQLARKHHTEPEGLVALLDALRDEFHKVERSTATLQELEQTISGLRTRYHTTAAQLSAERIRTAAILDRRITDIMQQLGMPGGHFRIQVTCAPERLTAHGTDEVELQVSANTGEPLKPLAKVISGGELSRIALAIQVVAAQASAIPTLVFDEVDSGIGGSVAEIVGRSLRSLGETRQVLCVTHLPQVASQAHHHLRVVKTARASVTLTRIENLDRKGQVDELARMLGGVEITETTRRHAREMIARAGQDG